MERHGRTLNASYEVKAVSLKGYLPYDSNYKAFWKKQNYAESKKISEW